MEFRSPKVQYTIKTASLQFQGVFFEKLDELRVVPKAYMFYNLTKSRQSENQ